jgi:hypothetical protein
MARQTASAVKEGVVGVKRTGLEGADERLP